MPPLLETRMHDRHRQHRSRRIYHPRRFEKRDKLPLLGAGKIRLIGRIGVGLANRPRKHRQWAEHPGVVPDIRANRSARVGYTRHFGESGDGVGHEVDHQLREYHVECVIGIGQLLSPTETHFHVGEFQRDRRDERLRGIDRRDVIGADAAYEFIGQRSGTATNIEDTLARLHPHEVGKLWRKGARVFAHEVGVRVRGHIERHLLTLRVGEDPSDEWPDCVVHGDGSETHAEGRGCGAERGVVRSGWHDASMSSASVDPAPSQASAPADRDDAPKAAKLGVDEALALAVDALGGEHRDGQIAMARAVFDVVSQRRRRASGPGSDDDFDNDDFAPPTHLLVQAGTGTGKSLAYLVPSILAANAHPQSNGRVVVATATLALQHQLIERDLPRVADALEPALGHRPTYAVLKGRHNYVCLDRLNRGPADDDDSEAALFESPRSALGKQSQRLRAWADTTETGDRDDYEGALDPRVWRSIAVTSRECVGASKCAYGQECFTELARARANESDIVVTNHAMLAIGVLENIPVLPEHAAVVIDEAHELVDRATSAVTVELGARALERAASRVRRHIDAVTHDRLDDAAALLGTELDLTASELVGPQRIERVEGSLLLALTGVRDATHAALADMAAVGRAGKDDEPDDAAARSQARAAIEEIHDVTGTLLSLDDTDVAWLDPGDRRAPVLRVAPLSVAHILRSELFDQTPVVMTSATLTLGGSFDPLATSVGLEASVDQDAMWIGLDVGSPFDFANQGILYVAAHLPRPGRDGVSDEALVELGDLLDSAGGRTLALFSSWRGVERAAEVLAARFADREDRPLLVAKRGDSVADLVRQFVDQPSLSLLGTMSLWQGVDVPGDTCSLVVIDRIPFPRPDDPLTAARSKRADESGSNGFMAVSVPRAALLLAQGSGRLIRSREDRGVVAVLDSRLATSAYGRYLRASMPPLWYTTDASAARGALHRLNNLP